MDGMKPWWESKTMWSDILTVITGLMVSFHVLTPDQAGVLNSDAPTLIMGIVTAVLGVVGLYGRITATKKVSI